MEAKDKLKLAVLWEPKPDKKVLCSLCNWRCLIGQGQVGYCGVRKNVDGQLYSVSYNNVCAANIDPIEKKPLFHFQPGSRSFSVAAIGCNFRCGFCQNWQISQAVFDKTGLGGESVPAEKLVDAAVKGQCKSMAYTYTEPTIFMELCEDCGRLAKDRGLANVFVSNGYMTKKAIDFAADWLDGINVDLKAFSEDYYQRLCKAKLGPVLETIEYIAKQTDIWLEVTTLLLPGQNDSDDELKKIAGFIADKAGVDVPWHISRFVPTYDYTDSVATPTETIMRAAEIGRKAGLRYVYPGNVPGLKEESTFCYKCGKMLIERIGYRIGSNEIIDGCCPDCGSRIAGFEV